MKLGLKSNIRIGTYALLLFILNDAVISSGNNNVFKPIVSYSTGLIPGEWSIATIIAMDGRYPLVIINKGDDNECQWIARIECNNVVMPERVQSEIVVDVVLRNNRLYVTIVDDQNNGVERKYSSGWLICYDLQSLEVIWNTSIRLEKNRDRNWGKILIHEGGDYIVVSAWERIIVCESKTGNMHAWFPGRNHQSPILLGSMGSYCVYAIHEFYDAPYNYQMYVLDPMSRRLLWSRRISVGNRNEIALRDNQIYYYTRVEDEDNDWNLYCRSLVDGELIWKVTLKLSVQFDKLERILLLHDRLVVTSYFTRKAYVINLNGEIVNEISFDVPSYNWHHVLNNLYLQARQTFSMYETETKKWIALFEDVREVKFSEDNEYIGVLKTDGSIAVYSTESFGENANTHRSHRQRDILR